MSNLAEDLKKKKPILGLEVALKKIKKQQVNKVYVASNCKEKTQVINLCKTMEIEVVEAGTSKELGALCKKTFSVSVVSFD